MSTTEKTVSAKRGADLEVEIFPAGTLFLRENIAEGKHGGVPVTVDITISGGVTLVRFEDDGVYYAFRPAAMIRAAWAVRERCKEDLRNRREPRPGAPHVACGPFNGAGKCLICGSLPPA